jgi:hypothetical protein
LPGRGLLATNVIVRFLAAEPPQVSADLKPSNFAGPTQPEDGALVNPEPHGHVFNAQELHPVFVAESRAPEHRQWEQAVLMQCRLPRFFERTRTPKELHGICPKANVFLRQQA